MEKMGREVSKHFLNKIGEGENMVTTALHYASRKIK